MREALPFLELPLPFCQRLMPLLVVLQSKEIKPENKLQLAFKTIDEDGSGAIDNAEFGARSEPPAAARDSPGAVATLPFTSF